MKTTMKTTKLTLMICLLAFAAISAYATTPNLALAPSVAILPEGTTMLFHASFSDGSAIKACQWATTGPNAIAGNYLGNPAEAVFSSGTTPGQYTVFAVCSNVNGITTIGTAQVKVVQ